MVVARLSLGMASLARGLVARPDLSLGFPVSAAEKRALGAAWRAFLGTTIINAERDHLIYKAFLFAWKARAE
jgi:hypothetical protein